MLALLCMLCCVLKACVAQGVQAEWLCEENRPVVVRESGEPLHLLMTNNESYPDCYHYENRELQLPYELKLGALVEVTVINHANSNYPIIPSLIGYFEYLSESPVDMEVVTRTNYIGTSWEERLLSPNMTYVLLARKNSMTDTGCSDCCSAEWLDIFLYREDMNQPGDQPPNTTVFLTCVMNVLYMGEDVDEPAFLDNRIVQVLCGVFLLASGIYVGTRIEKYRRQR